MENINIYVQVLRLKKLFDENTNVNGRFLEPVL